MILAVRIMMFAHAGALIFYFVGDKVIQAFKDDDKDGIPNAFDRHDNRHDRNRQNNQQPSRVFQSDAERHAKTQQDGQGKAQSAEQVKDTDPKA